MDQILSLSWHCNRFPEHGFYLEVEFYVHFTKMNRYMVRVLSVTVWLIVAASPCFAQRPCDDPEAAQWVKHINGSVTNYDELALHAIKRYGPPERCLGEVTSEFDGVEFGMLRLEFQGGAVFRIETQPPESSVATLSDSSGLGAASPMRVLLEQYAARIGLDIDWTSPTVEEEGHRRTVTFWDPEVGLNASARLTFHDTTLVAISLGLAL